MRTHRILLAFVALCMLPPLAASAQQGRTIYTATVGGRGHLGFFSEAVPDAPMHQRRVLEVVSESPAEKAGLRAGDILLRINGFAASPQVISSPFEPGDTVVLRIRRAGSERDLTVIAAERNDRVALRAGSLTLGLPDSIDRRYEITIERMRAGLDTAYVKGGLQLRRSEGDSGSVIIIGADTVHITSIMPARIHGVHVDTAISQIMTRTLPRILADSANFRIYSPDDSRMFSFDGDSAFFARAMPSFAVFGMRAIAGAELAPLNPELSEYFGAVDGVLVLSAAPHTPAGRAGLRGGDVVTHAGDTQVRAIRELQRAIEQAGRRDVTLRVLRHGRTVDVTITH